MPVMRAFFIRSISNQLIRYAVSPALTARASGSSVAGPRGSFVRAKRMCKLLRPAQVTLGEHRDLADRCRLRCELPSPVPPLHVERQSYVAVGHMEGPPWLRIIPLARMPSPPARDLSAG